MVTSDKYVQTVHALDRAYPDGWRSGDRYCDAVTVVLATGLREMLGALLGGHRG